MCWVINSHYPALRVLDLTPDPSSDTFSMFTSASRDVRPCNLRGQRPVCLKPWGKASKFSQQQHSMNQITVNVTTLPDASHSSLCICVWSCTKIIWIFSIFYIQNYYTQLIFVEIYPSVLSIKLEILIESISVSKVKLENTTLISVSEVGDPGIE